MTLNHLESERLLLSQQLFLGFYFLLLLWFSGKGVVKRKPLTMKKDPVMEKEGPHCSMMREDMRHEKRIWEIEKMIEKGGEGVYELKMRKKFW